MKCQKCGFINPGDVDICTRCGYRISSPPAGTTREVHNKRRGADETPIPGSSYTGKGNKDDSLAFSPGDNFGERYTILEEIDHGGMGRIFKAHDKILNIDVALKMIHPELLVNSNTIKRFKKETLLARQIAHDNIIRIHDFGEIRGINFISMDYIEGKNLADYLQVFGKPSIDTSVEIAKQICRGLSAAHKKGIIHRDLKPSNIMIDKNGRVFITDFGLARTLEDQKITRSGVLVGTPQYISPEQAKGEKADIRSDLYSLGVVLYELTTGHELFESDNLVGFLQKHLQVRPVPPTELDPDFPPFLERIILKCLRKNPDKRYQDTDEILSDLGKKKNRHSTILLTSKRKKILKSFFSFLLLIVIAIAAYLFTTWLKDRKSVMREEKQKVISLAVLNPEILMSEQKPAQIGRTIQGLLISDLSQSPYFNVLSDNSLYEILEHLNWLKKERYSNADLRRIAARGKVNYIIFGNYTQDAGNSRYNLVIYDVQKDDSFFSTIWGKEGDNIFSFVDLITREVKQKFFPGVELENDIDLAVNEITTTSIEAYHLYLQGKRYFWTRNFAKSSEILEKAIALDSRFAMAYKQLAINEIYEGRSLSAEHYLHKAMELIDRISQKEQYHIRIYENWYLKTSPQLAIKNCLEYLENYPGELEVKILLGSIYRNLGEWEKAEQVFYDILNSDKESWPAHMNLAYTYFVRGMFDKSLEVLLKGDNPELFAELLDYHRYLAYCYLSKKEYQKAWAQIEKVRALSTTSTIYRSVELIGQYWHLQGNLEKAQEHYLQLTKMAKENARSAGFSRLFRLYLLQGQYAAAKRMIEQGLDVCRSSDLKEDELQFLIFSAYLELRLRNPVAVSEVLDEARRLKEHLTSFDDFLRQTFLFVLQGQAYLMMDEIEKAKDIAKRLEWSVGVAGSNKHRRRYFLLNGLISMKEKKFEAAAENFKKAFRLAPYWKNDGDEQTLYLDNLGALYFEMGEYKKAEECYQEIQSASFGKLMWGDIYACSFYHLGQIYTKKGQIRQAIKQFKEFLRLFGGADPAQPAVQEATAQLLRLEEG